MLSPYDCALPTATSPHCVRTRNRGAPSSASCRRSCRATSTCSSSSRCPPTTRPTRCTTRAPRRFWPRSAPSIAATRTASALPPSRCGSATISSTTRIPSAATRARMSPRLVQVSLPLTDEEKPIRLALWRATDRSYKQASEALTRVRTNVAAKVQDENPAPDFSREEKQEHSSGAAVLFARHAGVGSAAAARVGGLQRRPAGAAQPGVADGRGRQPVLHQQRRLADRHRRRRRAASSFRA